ncbi:hypothetical protein [Streptomyces sp. NPDC051636]|uniref:hypothetical protein n=1 Tax=Streptomyces sp. NPDC051636 TaxID=3365663 RepID=UPI003788FCFF
MSQPGILRHQLITMAELLDHNPEHPASLPLTTDERVALANDITSGDRHFLDLLPRITQPTTRGDYANRLRQIAGAA